MVTCTKSGLTVTGIDAARAFEPGDQIEPDAVVATRGGQSETWRDVLGDHLASHFTPEPARHAAVPTLRKAED